MSVSLKMTVTKSNQWFYIKEFSDWYLDSQYVTFPNECLRNLLKYEKIKHVISSHLQSNNLHTQVTPFSLPAGWFNLLLVTFSDMMWKYNFKIFYLLHLFAEYKTMTIFTFCWFSNFSPSQNWTIVISTDI